MRFAAAGSSRSTPMTRPAPARRAAALVKRPDLPPQPRMSTRAPGLVIRATCGAAPATSNAASATDSGRSLGILAAMPDANSTACPAHTI